MRKPPGAGLVRVHRAQETGEPWTVGWAWAVRVGSQDGVWCRGGLGAGLQGWGDLVTLGGFVCCAEGLGLAMVGAGSVSLSWGSWKPVPKEFTGDRNFTMLGRGVSGMWRKVDF